MKVFNTKNKLDEIANAVTQNDFKKRLCLVTGGAGMIGSNLVKELIRRGFHVRVADNLLRGRLENLYSDAGDCVIDLEKDFFKVDLAVPGSCDAALDGVDFVYHLADVVAGIDYVFAHQGEIFRQNILINSNVISSVRKANKIKGVIYVGTACSFPADKQYGVEAPPLTEEDQYPANPESAYGWSKLMGEYESLLMEKEVGIPVCIPVLHNVYGTPCDYEIERSQVIPSLIRKAIKYPKEDFVVWGSGSQGRAFVYVDDIVDALIAIIPEGLEQGVIQIGPDVCVSIKQIAESIVDISGKEINIKYDTSKPEGDLGRCADYSKARAILGWKPKTKLRDGLTRVYRWIEEKLNT